MKKEQARALNSAEQVKKQTPNVAPELAAVLQAFRQEWKILSDGFQDAIMAAESDGETIRLLTLRIDATNLNGAVEQMSSAKDAEALAKAARCFARERWKFLSGFHDDEGVAVEEPGWRQQSALFNKAVKMGSAGEAVAVLLGVPKEAMKAGSMENPDESPLTEFQAQADFVIEVLDDEIGQWPDADAPGGAEDVKSRFYYLRQQISRLIYLGEALPTAADGAKNPTHGGVA